MTTKDLIAKIRENQDIAFSQHIRAIEAVDIKMMRYWYGARCALDEILDFCKTSKEKELKMKKEKETLDEPMYKHMAYWMISKMIDRQEFKPPNSGAQTMAVMERMAEKESWFDAACWIIRQGAKNVLVSPVKLFDQLIEKYEENPGWLMFDEELHGLKVKEAEPPSGVTE